LAERRREDDARIEAVRSLSDEELRGERSDRAQALKALFEVERKLTDTALVTERALADVALAARDKFLGIVAHDLRTPLTQISLRAAFLRTDAPSGEEGNVARRTSAAIERAIRRMDVLVGDLLDAAAIELGTLPVVLSKQDLTTLLSDVAGDLRPIAEERAHSGLRGIGVAACDV
jgi:signal transduction histidine kinase